MALIDELHEEVSALNDAVRALVEAVKLLAIRPGSSMENVCTLADAALHALETAHGDEGHDD